MWNDSCICFSKLTGVRGKEKVSWKCGPMKRCARRFNMLAVRLPATNDLYSSQYESEAVVSTKKYATFVNLQTAYEAEVRYHRWYAQFPQTENNNRFGDGAVLGISIVPSSKIMPTTGRGANFSIQRLSSLRKVMNRLMCTGILQERIGRPSPSQFAQAVCQHFLEIPPMDK